MEGSGTGAAPGESAPGWAWNRPGSCCKSLGGTTCPAQGYPPWERSRPVGTKGTSAWPHGTPRPPARCAQDSARLGLTDAPGATECVREQCRREASRFRKGPSADMTKRARRIETILTRKERLVRPPAKGGERQFHCGWPPLGARTSDGIAPGSRRGERPDDPCPRCAPSNTAPRGEMALSPLDPCAWISARADRPVLFRGNLQLPVHTRRRGICGGAPLTIQRVATTPIRAVGGEIHEIHPRFRSPSDSS